MSELPEVTISRRGDHTRFTVGTYEASTHRRTRRRTWAVSSVPVSELPQGAARAAILAAMERETQANRR